MHDIVHSISERSITQSYVYSANNKHVEENTLSLSRIVSNSEIKQNKYIQVECDKNESFHSVTLRFDTEYVIDGIALQYRIREWEEIQYLALGCNNSGKFHHVKVTNPQSDEWQTLFFSFDDLSYLIQNNFEKNTNGLAVQDISIKIKGSPHSNKSFIDILKVILWSENKSEKDDWMELKNHNRLRLKLIEKIHDYQTSSLKNSVKVCEKFFENGSCPIVKNLDWPDQNRKPPDLQEVNTYRYSWHALHHVANLILYSKMKATDEPIEYAQLFTKNWMENSWILPDEDVRFTWYDHGTAERQLSLIMMYHESILLGNIDREYLTRLKKLIVLQGRLLESEVFYARNQLERYHNHAMFQDVSLIITALSFPKLKSSRRWLQTAVRRLEDQVSRLIIREGRYAIFVENSIGYHSGIIRLLKFSSELISLFDTSSIIHAVYSGMDEFAELMKYPDGRSPAQGDTQRIANIDTNKKYSRPQEAGVTILPKAGYCIAKGTDKGSNFMLTMFATSLSKTHKHQDNLSFTLFFDMVEWLIDPSHYSHEYDKPIAKYLRSASGHNVIALPELTASIGIGLAALTGFEENNKFSFDGENMAYSGNVIKRTIKGRIDKLELHFKDFVESNHLGELDARLMLQCGEHVLVEQNETEVILSSHLSKYKLLIELPSNKISINFGLDDENNVRGISGLGFMEYSSINTIECLVPTNQELCWRISVIEDEETEK